MCERERERTGVSDMSGNEVKIEIILSFFFLTIFEGISLETNPLIWD